MRKRHYTILALCFFTLGTFLRTLLCWSNPPRNSFDDHFEPILLIMRSGTIPAKDACWQCYHPPVFYWVSAMVGKIAVAMGVNTQHTLKLLQFIPCLYGILTLAVIYLILNKLDLPDFAKLIAFGAVCFLPRHIYMSAMNSNDTISYLFVALSVYLLMVLLDRKLSWMVALVASVVISIGLFTKYTSYVLLPIVLIMFVQLVIKPVIATRKHVLSSFLLVVLLPTILLGAYFMGNMKKYDTPLPWNLSQLDPSITQPRDQSSMDFLSFKPWQAVTPPMLVPGKMHSFWTLVYTGMWFDNEPKFLYYLDSDWDWWVHYYGWIQGKRPFPARSMPISRFTRAMGFGLIVLGLFPLLFIGIGLYVLFRRYKQTWTKASGTEAVRMSIFPTLLISNVVGIVALALRLPTYTAAKASYFLNSLPAFAVFLALGLVPLQGFTRLEWSVAIVFAILFALVSLHILHICYWLI